MLVQVHDAFDAAQTKIEQKLTKIVLGEPDPALFQIPPDYRVVERVREDRKPSQMKPLGGVSTEPATAPPEAPHQ